MNTKKLRTGVGACALGVGLWLVTGAAAWALGASAPSAGTILQQSQPAQKLPKPPGQVLKLPAPVRQMSRSKLLVPIKSIRIVGNHWLKTAQLKPLVAPLEGHTVTLGMLQKAVSRITAAYRRHGYILAYAFLPVQTVRHGVVEVRVIEPRYDRVEVTGHGRLRPSQARHTLGVKPGQPISLKPLNRGLLQLLRTPGVRVGAIFIPGAQPSTSALRLKLLPAPLFRGSVAEDNYGADSTGRYRTLADVSLDNPFGFGSQFAVNGLTTSGGLLHSGGFAVVSPDLWNGLRAGVYGSRTLYRLGGAFASLGQRGHAEQMGVDITYPVILQPGRLLTARLDLLRNGLEERNTLTGYDKRSHLYLGRLSLNGVYAGRSGGLNTAQLSIVRGTLAGDNATARLDQAAVGSAGAFWLGALTVSRNQPLWLGFAGRLSVSGQAASTNLDGSQKLYLGGPRAVMSYPVGDVGGDEGIFARGRLSHRLRLPHWVGRLRVALLVQGGTVWVNHSVYAGFSGSNRMSVGGAGVGLNYAWRHHLHIRIDYVHVLGASSNAQGGEVWARLRLST